MESQEEESESGSDESTNDITYLSEILTPLTSNGLEPKPDCNDFSSLRNTLSKEALIWRVFKKQADALDCASKLSHLGVMTFAYHHSNYARRFFLVAHPLELWFRNKMKDPYVYNYEEEESESGSDESTNDITYLSEILTPLTSNGLEPKPDCNDFSSLRNTLSKEALIWRVFKKQADALDCASKLSHLGVMTFAYHHSNYARRFFLVTHPLELWFRNKMKDPYVYNYEVIAEGQFSKLYLDLEFDRTLNPYHDGAAMTETFNKVMLYVLNEDFNFALDTTHIINLDSTTDTKFSRHIIYQYPFPVMFRTNIEVGYSVKKACNLIRRIINDHDEKEEGDEEVLKILKMDKSELEKLEVVNKKGQLNLFVDEGVYTKNRHFRLYGSTKFGRNAPLVLSKENKFLPPFTTEELNEEYIFLSSLVTYCTMIEFIVPVTVPKTMDNPHQIPTLSGKSDKSPFPNLDKFITKLIQPCHIENVLNYDNGDIYVFASSESGYCSNVERQHTKSRVLYVVNTKKGAYYQKCHHPHCRNFQSKLALLPKYIQNEIGVKSEKWDTALSAAYSLTKLDLSQFLDGLDDVE